MTQTRSKRRLILDRLERNLTAISENVRRLEEIEGFYIEAQETYGEAYGKYIAMIDELRKAEITMVIAYKTFYDMAKP